MHPTMTQLIAALSAPFGNRSHKGQFGNLVGAAIGLAIFGTILTLGSIFTADLNDQFPEVRDINGTLLSNETAVINNVQEGFVSFSGFIPLIVLAIVFVIIIGLLFVVLRQQSANGGGSF